MQRKTQPLRPPQLQGLQWVNFWRSSASSSPVMAAAKAMALEHQQASRLPSYRAPHNPHGCADPAHQRSNSSWQPLLHQTRSKLHRSSCLTRPQPETFS
uniref:WPK1 n=1 Tax=Arundo donax TaxID=35708 RepID=A0A0A8YFE8_ARUDO